jgi:hypothetical protein
MHSRLASCLFLLVLLFPVSGNALMRGQPDDANLIVREGDAAPLDAQDLKKAHEDGKAIVLMFGNVDQCLNCERTWDNILSGTAKHKNGSVAVNKDYLPAEIRPANPEDAVLAAKYGLIGEPWVFIIDKAGVVRHVFKGLVSPAEIEAQIMKLENLRSQSSSTKENEY